MHAAHCPVPFSPSHSPTAQGNSEPPACFQPWWGHGGDQAAPPPTMADGGEGTQPAGDPPYPRHPSPLLRSSSLPSPSSKGMTGIPQSSSAGSLTSPCPPQSPGLPSPRSGRPSSAPQGSGHRAARGQMLVLTARGQGEAVLTGSCGDGVRDTEGPRSLPCGPGTLAYDCPVRAVVPHVPSRRDTTSAPHCSSPPLLTNSNSRKQGRMYATQFPPLPRTLLGQLFLKLAEPGLTPSC